MLMSRRRMMDRDKARGGAGERRGALLESTESRHERLRKMLLGKNGGATRGGGHR